MYLDFFKFKKNPFHITPDPDFLFLSPSHKEASASIFYGIEERKGFVAVTGEVGVGKTTILRSYLEGTDPDRIRIVYIFNAALSFDKLLKQIVSELGIQAADEDPSSLVEGLFHYLIDEYKNERNVVLIIDEAQNMPVETLERLRMLSNLETSQDKLLQIILVGQPEFDDKLNLPELRQLKQRIAIRCRIDALVPDESLAYIHHRLMKASLFHNPVFTKDALKCIVKEANGIPRIINVLCDNALVTAFGYQRKPVDNKIVKEVIKDLQGGQPRGSFSWKIIWVPALIVCLVLIAFVSRGLLPNREIADVTTQTFKKIPKPPPAAEKVRQPRALHSVDKAARSKKTQAATKVKTAVKSASKAKPEPAVAEVPSAVNPHKSKNKPAATKVKAAVKSVSKAKSGPAVAEVEPPAVNAPQSKSEPAATKAKNDVKSESEAKPEPAVQKAATAGGDKGVSKIAPAESSVQPLASLPLEGDQTANSLPSLIVKRGDSVSKLLMDAYGRVDERMLRSFKDLNPQIKNINRILVGEKIVLPKSQPEKP